jgi:hypothetical protein
LKLPQVTLIAVSGIGYDSEGHKKAFEKSCRNIDFGAVKHIELGEIKDIDTWNKAVIYELPKYVETDFALLIHPDGYVVNADCWDDNWLNYDYIGSPWPEPQDTFSYRDVKGEIQRVGNSVSLRSKRLLDVANKRNLEWKPFYGYYNEDGFICVNYRHIYEEEGCRFAPLEEAVRFGKEWDIPENRNINKTFVFHSTQ